ncbi:MAG: alkaline phosphatase [Lentisphaerae bacterium]|nr:alkaline phosphatase [Lentisphaerota bacterium]
MKKFFLLLLLFVFTTAAEAAGVKPKYIFLFIGDGMATPQRMIGNEFSRKMGRGDLVMNTLLFHGTTRTSSANALITDSAAAATAIACGQKTNNGMIGMTPDGKAIPSVAENARDKGKKVGIITSVNLNHATPSGFYGHQRNRGMYYELATDLVASNFDFFGGGGILKYNQAGKKNIYDLAREKGYTVAVGKKAVNALKPGKKVIALAGDLQNQMPYSIDATEKDITLAEITAKAIEMLDNPNGFFIMIEGGAIDWAGHANEAASNLGEVLALDNAVKTALEFYKKHPAETLIIVTGDHETGAMTMGFAGSGKNMNIELLLNQKVSAGMFSRKLQQAKAADKEFSFDDAKKMLSEYFGFKFSGDAKKDPMVINAAELKKLQDNFEKDRLHLAAMDIIARKAGIGWNSGSHTALPVLTTSIGCGAEIFTGFFENTGISRKINTLL